MSKILALLRRLRLYASGGIVGKAPDGMVLSNVRGCLCGPGYRDWQG